MTCTPIPTIALVIGHRPSSPGAANPNTGLSEYAFNSVLAQDIANEFTEARVNVQLVYRSSYRGLPGQINALNPAAIISLHCNAFNTRATGTEVLYYHSSRQGKELASVLQDNLIAALGLKDRGVKPKHSEDRGGYLLRYTNAPCVIAEPFFIDNDKDLAIAEARQEQLITAYSNTITSLTLGAV